MSGLLAEARAQSSRQYGPCGVGRFVAESLDDDDRDDLAKAATDPTVSTSAIHRVLADRGLPTGREAVRAHLKGACACGRSR